MKDWRGNEIRPGSIIVYPGRKSSSMWMVEAEVIEVTCLEHWDIIIPALIVQPMRTGQFGRPDKSPVKLTALERVTVVGHADDREKLHVSK